jgi:pentose-5-phosphate-3-epimerase
MGETKRRMIALNVEQTKKTNAIIKKIKASGMDLGAWVAKAIIAYYTEDDDVNTEK